MEQKTIDGNIGYDKHTEIEQKEQKCDVSQQTLDKCNQKIAILRQKIKQKRQLIQNNIINYSNDIQNHNINLNKNIDNIDGKMNHLYNIYCVYKQYRDDLKWDDDENLSLQQFSSDPSWVNMDSHVLYDNVIPINNDAHNDDTAKMTNNDSNNSNSSDNSSKGGIGSGNDSDFRALHIININSKRKHCNHSTSTKRVDSGAVYHPVLEYEEHSPQDDETLTMENINGEHGEHREHSDHYNDRYHNKYTRIVTRSNSLNNGHHFQSDIDGSNNNSRSSSSTDKLDIKMEVDVQFKVTQTLKGHTGKVYAFDVSHNDRSIVSCGHDGFMILWDIESEQKRLALQLESRYITSTQYCNFNGTHKTLVACAGLDKILYVYDLSNQYGFQSNKDGKNQSLISSLNGHNAYISSIKSLPDYKILSASGDGSCILWDIVKSEEVQMFRSDTSSDFTTMEIFNTLNGNTFMTGSVDGYIRMYDLRQSEHIHKFLNGDNINKKSDVNIIKSFKNNTSFAAGSEDGNIRFYDLRSYQQLNHYAINDDILDSTSCTNINGVSCIDFSKSGSFLFNAFEYKEPNSSLNKNVNSRGSLINNCIVRHTITGQKIDDLHSDSPVTWLNVAKNGKFIVTSHINKTLSIWKPQKKRRFKSRDLRSYSSYSNK